jgi:hypothetical protein
MPLRARPSHATGLEAESLPDGLEEDILQPAQELLSGPTLRGRLPDRGFRGQLTR